MALKPIRVVPTELPQARLYLEDVEEITQLLQENLPPDAAGQPPRIKYKLTEETADSIDDLKEKGTVSKSLEISAASCDVTIGRISSIRCYGLNDVIPRTLHSSVTQVFNRRKRRFFNFLQPDGIRFALFSASSQPFHLRQTYSPLQRTLSLPAVDCRFLDRHSAVSTQFFLLRVGGQQGVSLLPSGEVQNREG